MGNKALSEQTLAEMEAGRKAVEVAQWLSLTEEFSMKLQQAFIRGSSNVQFVYIGKDYSTNEAVISLRGTSEYIYLRCPITELPNDDLMAKLSLLGADFK